MALLGELEQAVMDVLWQRGEPLTVRDVHELLAAQRELAYTTVMTVLDRLAKKDIVERELDGRAWRYTAAKSRAAMVADEIDALLAEGTREQRDEVWREVQRRLFPAEPARSLPRS